MRIRLGKLFMKYNPVLAASRNATLLLTKLNAGGLANTMYHAASKKNSKLWQELSHLWDKIGGKPDVLYHAIKQGMRVEYKHHKNQHATSEAVFSFDGMPDNFEPVTTGAAAATAAPLIVKIMNLLKKYGIDPKDALDKLKGLGKQGFDELVNKHKGDIANAKDGDTVELTAPNFGDIEKATEQQAENENKPKGGIINQGVIIIAAVIILAVVTTGKRK